MQEKRITFKHDATCIGFVTDSLDEYNKLVNYGHQNITCADRSRIIEDMQPLKDTTDFYQISNVISDNNSLRSFNLSCSCFNCCNGMTFSYWFIRNPATHSLKMKRTCTATENEVLKTMNMSKLTIDKLKSELLCRSLSISHKVEAELASRLLKYIADNDQIDDAPSN